MCKDLNEDLNRKEEKEEKEKEKEEIPFKLMKYIVSYLIEIASNQYVFDDLSDFIFVKHILKYFKKFKYSNAMNYLLLTTKEKTLKKKKNNKQ